MIQSNESAPILITDAMLAWLGGLCSSAIAGIGFSKTFSHNFQLIRDVARFRDAVRGDLRAIGICVTMNSSLRMKKRPRCGKLLCLDFMVRC